jgi:zinc protease
MIQTVHSYGQNIPLDPAVRTGKLANGFTYYIRHNEEPKKRVIIYLANKVGSILENDDQRGLAHFMEHMNFNGTTHFPKNSLIDYLQKSGVRFGADVNAYTAFDETVYQLPLPTDDPEVLKNGFLIMRDWAKGALLEQGEIDKERGVIMEEKRLRKGAQQRNQDKMLPILLNNSRYAERLPIGTEEVLNNFTREKIRSFYDNWYRPDLQALIIVGDIDVDEMESIVKAKFSDLRNPDHEPTRIEYKVSLTGKNQFLVITDPEVTSTSLQLLIKKEKDTLRTVEEYRRAIIEALVNMMLGQRYGELAQKPEITFFNGGSGFQQLSGGLKALGVIVEVAKPGLAPLEKGFKDIWRELIRAKQFGFMLSELDRVKSNYANFVRNSWKEKDKTPSGNYVEGYLRYFLAEEAAPGIEFENELVKNLLPGISLEDVNTLLKEAIKDRDRDIIITAPEKEKMNLPDSGTVNGWIRSVQNENIDRYKDDKEGVAFLKKAPVKGKIVSEKRDVKMGTTTLIFSNGAKAVLRPTKYKNDEIFFAGFSPGGTSLYSGRDIQSAINAAGIIGSFGAGNYNNVELGKYLTGRQARVNVGISETAQSVSGTSSVKDFSTALELAYAFMVEPRKDTAMFRSIIARSKDALTNRGDDPLAVFNDTAVAILNNYNERRTAPSIEKIEQINLDRSYAIYKERFANANGFQFTFVGSFNVDSIREMLERYIGGLPSLKTIARSKDLNIEVPSGRIEKTIYKGTEDKSSVQIIFAGPFRYTSKESITMQALNESLQLRLIERLRENEGGVYSPVVGASVSRLPHQRYSFSISFGCSPSNADKLTASALDEIEKLKRVGPPAVNVEKYIAETLRDMETGRQSNGWWVGYIIDRLTYNDDWYQYKKTEGLIKSVTVADVKAAAQKYLTGKNYIRLMLMPEKK